MIEIGGFLGLETLINKPYYTNVLELNSARNALLYLMKAKKINKIYLPYYLCNSVSDILEKHNYNFEYYNIGTNFMPKFDRRLAVNEYIYIVNYYGQVNNNLVLSLKQKYNNIILDNTQAFFQEPLSNIDTIYSLRKYFGVPDGAYLSTNCSLDENLIIDVSNKRMTHLLGRFEENAYSYYKHFKENDRLLADVPLKKMSKITRNILGAINYDSIIKIRNENFLYLMDNLSKENILNLNIPNGAFAYPFLINNGNFFREKLVEKKIYIPLLWPNVLNENHLNSIENNYALNILPLPCDQRYSINEMKYIIDMLRSIMNEK